MCLVKQKNWFQKLFNLKVKPKKARKDIVVYKVLRKTALCDYLYSPVRDFRYDLNKLYKVDSLDIHYDCPGSTFIKVERGLHAYSTLKRAKDKFDTAYPYYRVYQAIIPKGSLYIEGEDEEIVSNQLIVQKEIQLCVYTY